MLIITHRILVSEQKGVQETHASKTKAGKDIFFQRPNENRNAMGTVQARQTKISDVDAWRGATLWNCTGCIVA